MTEAPQRLTPPASPAPVGRAAPCELRDQAARCGADPVIQAVLAAVDGPAAVLNAQRQILAANPAMQEGFLEPGPGEGQRLGEAFHCVHAEAGPDGCGSSRACAGCGALRAVLATLDTQGPAAGEYLLSFREGDRWVSREFAVRTLPLTVAGQPMVLLTLRDLGAQKRRESLERTFIHDLIGPLKGLQGWTEMLQGAGVDGDAIAGRILDLTTRLTAEVEWQRQLLLAERGELTANLRPVRPEALLDALMGALDPAQAARVIRVAASPGAPLLKTDPALLGRILVHMVRNALEAMPQGGQARVGHAFGPEGHTFSVQNPGSMPPEVADRVFQRSFTTKAGQGRGLGTYGMKVLGEGVLGGRVGFSTCLEEGTRFFLTLPLGG